MFPLTCNDVASPSESVASQSLTDLFSLAPGL